LPPRLSHTQRLPFSSCTSEPTQPPETPTGSDGWATLQIKTTKSLPDSGALVMQVRARGPGTSDEAILGGFTTRRLVQITLH
jgi:hypothetical protein